jgi:pimeloyl-ACP methyl ester carboxylesterase
MVALVLLPGMDGSRRLREDFVAALGPGIEPAIISYPADCALGYSEIESLARSILPADRPYVLLGESFSGPIAISIAASRPPGLVGLVLCCSYARNPHPAFGLFRWLLPLFPFKLAPIGLLSPLLMGRYASAPIRTALQSALADVPSATLRARAAAVLKVDVSSALPEIRVPVLYLRATDDRLVARSCSDAIVRGAPQTLVVDVDAPHFMLGAAPADAAVAVKNFVHALPPYSTSVT